MSMLLQPSGADPHALQHLANTLGMSLSDLVLIYLPY